MKRVLAQIIRWLFPAAFIGLGVFCYTTVHGHSFLGLVSFAIAGVLVCYNLLWLLRSRQLWCAKILQTIFTTLLCLGLLVCGVTEILVLRSSLGSSDQSCDYLVVLGAKVNGTSPSVILQDRLDAAYDYLVAHPQTVAVLSGGQGADEGISEAQCMYEQLTQRGIDPQRLWLEDKSTSTWENLKFSQALILEKTGESITRLGILSSEFHLFRASLFAGSCGIEPTLVPARTSWPTLQLNYFLREVAGVWHYILLGGQYA